VDNYKLMTGIISFYPRRTKSGGFVGDLALKDHRGRRRRNFLLDSQDGDC
jgi:hypothetical protein